MRREVKIVLGAACLLAAGVVWCTRAPAVERATRPLEFEAYAWQREWSAQVREAVAIGGRTFARLVVLCAEVSFRGDAADVARVNVDWASLARSGTTVGLALRVGVFPGPFVRDDEHTRGLVQLARELVAAAARGNVTPAELQLDFDCASSKLAGYRIWVEELRAAVAPIPITITVLPAWLDRRDFSALAEAADGFVLQVHSLARPNGAAEKLTLCDAPAARRWVEQAARHSRPFRVALPTYGYLVAFAHDGSFLDLVAEGADRNWPAGSSVREARADPKDLAELVASWAAERPAPFAGIIWYRLPVAGDTRNWSWPTLGAVMAGRDPRALPKVDARTVEPGLAEIALVNDGDGALSLPQTVALRWEGARLLAGDTYGGVEWIDGGKNEVTLRVSAPECASIAPGTRRPLAWIRLSNETTINAQVTSAP